MNFGKYLRSLREEIGLSQLAVASASGLSVRHYQDIEYDVRKCRIDTLEKILKVYRMNVLNFFDQYFIEVFNRHGAAGFAKVFENIHFVSGLVNQEGTIVSVSETTGSVLGFHQEEITGKMQIWDRISKTDDRNFVKDIFALMAVRGLPESMTSNSFSWNGHLLSKDDRKVKVRCHLRKICQGEMNASFEFIAFALSSLDDLSTLLANDEKKVTVWKGL